MEGITFTSRYGARNPSKLRSCYRCDAMGCYPQPPVGAKNSDGSIQIDHEGEWEFVVCPECHGSTHCSWFVTAMRVPVWLYQGIPFVWRYGFRKSFGPAEDPRHKHVWIAFKVAYLADLGLWNPSR